MPAWCILLKVDVDQRRLTPMDRRNPETVGVRRTGWAALDRDPQQDTVEFICPHCGARDKKNARRERALYRFTDGFLQDLHCEVTQCHACTQCVARTLLVCALPMVMVVLFLELLFRLGDASLATMVVIPKCPGRSGEV